MSRGSLEEVPPPHGVGPCHPAALEGVYEGGVRWCQGVYEAGGTACQLHQVRVGNTRAVLRLVWPSILLQSAHDRITTAAKPVAASRLWCAVPVKQRTKKFKRFLNLIVSLGHRQKLTHCWHHGTGHTCKVS